MERRRGGVLRDGRTALIIVRLLTDDEVCDGAPRTDGRRMRVRRDPLPYRRRADRCRLLPLPALSAHDRRGGRRVGNGADRRVRIPAGRTDRLRVERMGRAAFLRPLRRATRIPARRRAADGRDQLRDARRTVAVASGVARLVSGSFAGCRDRRRFAEVRRRWKRIGGSSAPIHRCRSRAQARSIFLRERTANRPASSDAAC
ncbi:hypothetical protein F01_320081 [Burkholderia cenocepacia]|nr:hypothetical protein F01_320081 [Burkholderia cenocepacia]